MGSVEIREHPTQEIAVNRRFNIRNKADRLAMKSLDLLSLYARNPSAVGEQNPHRPMTAKERLDFMSKGDRNHITHTISRADDKKREAIGFHRYSRTDSDDRRRMPVVKKIVRKAGLDTTYLANRSGKDVRRKVKFFEYNFDLPENKDYVPLAMSALKQEFESFFRQNPHAGLVFYFGHDDLKEDPDDYNILKTMGFTDVGQLNYDHPGKPGTADEPNDHVLFLDKSHFEYRALPNLKKPREHATFKLTALTDLDRRARLGLR